MMVATFLLTVLVDLTVAIGVGMVLAAFLFMKRMAEVTNVTIVTRELKDDLPGRSRRPRGPSIGASFRTGVEVYEINGPFFFGAAEKFKETLAQVSRKPRVLIIRMRNVPAIDSTAMHALKDLVRRTRADGTLVMLSDVHSQPLVALERSALLEEIGRQHLFGNVDEAIQAARVHLAASLASTPAQGDFSVHGPGTSARGAAGRENGSASPCDFRGRERSARVRAPARGRASARWAAPGASASPARRARGSPPSWSAWSPPTAPPGSESRSLR